MHFSWITETGVIQKTMGRIVSHEVRGSDLFFNGEEGRLKIRRASGSLHVSYTCKKEFSGIKSFAVDQSGEALPAPALSEDGDHFSIQNGSACLTIAKRTSALTFTDLRNNVILETHPFAWRKDTDAYTVTAAFRMRDNERFYGLGEKTGFLNKRGYRYRMWNSGQTTYTPGADPLGKSIPLVIAFNGQSAYGLFVDKTCNMYMDLGETDDEKYSIEVNDSELEFYFLAGPSIKDVVSAYTLLTGRINLPPRWALGYQQCRWSYYDEKQVMELADQFRKKDIPCDVIYLDVDFMDGFRAFTWDPNRFPNPEKMTAALLERGFRIAVIMETGIKVESSYDVYTSGVREGVFCAKPGEPPYQTDLWAGKTVFPDFTMEKTRKWWCGWQSELLGRGVSGLWVDMNEPTDFSAEAEYDWAKATVPADVILDHEGQPASFDLYHNAYGNCMSRAAHEAFAVHKKGERSFVISRAAYAGIQRYACVWTGDNHSWWEHIAASMPMIMNLGLSGVPFAGGDVGGFQGNATGELFARWMQMGIFTPFFRGHSARGTKPHEPWAFGGAVEEICRRYIKLRYALLPYLYNEFYKCSEDGLPIVRPLVLEYPGDAEVYDLCDEFLFGESLLVAPIYRPATERRIVYLPEGQWYDYWTDRIYPGKEYHTVYAPLSTLPLFVKSGSILPMAEPMDYAGQKKAETLFLEVYDGTSSDYLLYEDDGTSMRYREGICSLTLFSLDRKGSSRRFSITPRKREYDTGRKYYSVRFHGLEGRPKFVCSEVPIEETFDEQRGLLSLLLPDTAQSKDCGGELSIEIQDVNK